MDQKGGAIIKKERLDIDRVAFIGRTYDEYVRIFGLDDSLLGQGRILDCPAGAASFAAEACRSGFDVVACDVLYDLPPDELIAKGEGDIKLIYDKVGEVSHLYVWDYYRDRDDLVAMREKALALFAEGLTAGIAHGRYVKASLPALPFEDDTFSLVLSGHFLFLYGDMLDLDFHKASLMELIRVSSGEVRIFPLEGLDLRPYCHLDEILLFLDSEGVDTEIVKVPFEFQRGANRMMKLRRRSTR
ncbi:MAG: class I SAM-dependent methyltransferase [Acidobacteriota bacterium]